MLRLKTRRTKIAALAIAVAIASCVGVAFYWHYLFVFYPEHAVTTFIGSSQHRTVAKRHSDYDWYVQVELPPGLGDAVLEQHPFRQGYDPHMPLPKIPSPDIKACTTCWSYYEGHGHGMYGYMVAVLSPDRKSFQLYEFFGD
jgi:hypothetical protein